MKRFNSLLFLSLFLGIFYPAAVFAEGHRSITILYTGAVRGMYDSIIGCGCSSGPSGGLAKRAHMIESIRKDKQSVLLLDNGAVFNNQEDNAELHLKAMERMGYDALNLGVSELSFGKAFLERTHSQVSFPYIASNLYGGSRPPWIREYVIREVGGIKVAILGVLDPDDFKKLSGLNDLKGFEVIPPEVALTKLLPEVRGKADMVVLLTQLGALGEQKALALVAAIPEIDAVIFSERNNLVRPPEKNVIFLQTGSNGNTIGLLTITLNDKGVISVSERRDVPLNDSVSENSQMLALIETYEKEQKIKVENREKELMDGLKLTPQEFMERLRKKQDGQKRGEAQ